MIFAKIDPVLSMVTQDSLFNPTTTFITGSYMNAVANQYQLGAESVNFRISFGECEINNDTVISFKPIHQETIQLSGEELESWGTDDSTVLDIIAEQKGISVVEIVHGNINNF